MTPSEIISKRTETSKTYALGGNKYRCIVSGVMHYKDDYADTTEPWKDIDLSWQGNRIDKAPYILTHDGNSITVLCKKTGKSVTVELLEIGKKKIPVQAWERIQGIAKAPGIVNLENVALDTDLEITAGLSQVRFTRVLKSSKAPTDAKFRVTGELSVRVAASNADGVLPVERTMQDGVLTESLAETPTSYPVRIDPVITLQPPTKDTSLTQNQPTTPQGAVDTLYTVDRVSWVQRPLLAFDISDVLGGTVSSATLSLYYKSGLRYSTPSNMNVHKALRPDWVESEATWNNYKAATPWTTAGGDFVTSNPSGDSITPPASSVWGWVNFNVAAIVQDAADNGLLANFIVKFATENKDLFSRNNIDFASKEYPTDLTLRPKLTIDYTAGGPSPITLSGRSSTLSRASAAINTAVSVSASSATASRATASVSVALAITARSVTPTRALISIDTKTSLQIRAPTASRASVAIDVTIQAAGRSATTSRDSAAINTLIALSGRSATTSRTEVVARDISYLSGSSATNSRATSSIDTTIALSALSATGSRAITLIDTLVTLAGVSQTASRTECYASLATPFSGRSVTDSRTATIIDTIITLAGFSLTGSRTVAAIEVGIWEKRQRPGAIWTPAAKPGSVWTPVAKPGTTWNRKE